ncbi:MAG: hypothetical protein WA624_10610 [Methylocella sp.]
MKRIAEEDEPLRMPNMGDVTDMILRTLFQITESGLIQIGTKERLRRPLWEKAIVDAEELLKTKRMSLLQRKAIEADIKRCRLAIRGR